MIESFAVVGFDLGGGAFGVSCPSCGCENTHHYLAEVFFRLSEDSAEGIHLTADRDGFGVDHSMEHCPSDHRSGIRVYLYCEQCPARFALCISQHKGITQFYGEIFPPSQGDSAPSGLKEKCESPIEEMLFDALSPSLLSMCELQYQIGRFRVDFAWPSVKLAVECDGHRWHSNSKAQARDAKRDRELAAAGWLVLRFAGTELHRNALAVVDEIATHMKARSAHA